ncbi:MAG TPA: ATP-binding protein [Crocinitomicaceae bacterium]|nr:ATP-binding protein [Crocinitomicaceae bacterium]
MKISYKQRLFLYFGTIFILFTIGIVVFEKSSERNFKTQALEEKLEAYTNLINAKINSNALSLDSNMNELNRILPDNLRITIISLSGGVVFDNSIADVPHMTNHLNRPEIVASKANGKGTDIRLSTTNQHKYLYFAEKSNDYYIRVALPYNIQLQQILKPDNAFIYFIIISLFVFLLFIHFVTNRFAKTVNQLRDFAVYPEKYDTNQLLLPNDELGEIGNKIIDSYNQLKESKKNILQEKQRLLQHIQILEEGICFFSKNDTIEFHNGLFIQYLNILTDEPTSDATVILKDAQFFRIQEFIRQKETLYSETTLIKQGKIFSLSVNIFEDESYEIIINDITKQEKTRQLKQEMTGNIAHEIRTPITSIRGYLETILNTSLPDDKKEHFIQQAYNQTLAMTELVEDMSLIAKIEENPDSFISERINMLSLLEKIKDDFHVLFEKNTISMKIDIPSNVILHGSSNLLYALFRNLTENTIRYAGNNIQIVVKLYSEDNDFYYFSFYDTGIGISDEKHLNRIFERFYRINEGRTRNTGGSGLGLSIVKNAIQYHKGKITAKNRKEGGLEFLFQLRK